MAHTPNKAASKKPKLVRDSFTIPKAEYVVIEDLKVRAMALGTSVKKSELLRAGLKLLQSLDNSAYKAALAAVPALKTGRPAGAAPGPQEVKALRTPSKPAARKTTATTAVKAPVKNAAKTATPIAPKVAAPPAVKSVVKPTLKAAARGPLKAPVKTPVKAPVKAAAAPAPSKA
jgi:hypothetical protein